MIMEKTSQIAGSEPIPRIQKSDFIFIFFINLNFKFKKITIKKSSTLKAHLYQRLSNPFLQVTIQTKRKREKYGPS